MFTRRILTGFTRHCSREFSTGNLQEKGVSNGKQALEHIKTLYQGGQYSEALQAIDWTESHYPTCTKAAKYYRGKVSVALLDKEGRLEGLRSKDKP